MIEGDIFLISLGVMVRLLLVASVGAYAATRPKGGPPLLPEAAIQQLSRFSAVCLIPCIIVDSIGSSVSLELLRQSVALVVYGLVTIGLGLGYARRGGLLGIFQILKTLRRGLFFGRAPRLELGLGPLASVFFLDA